MSKSTLSTNCETSFQTPCSASAPTLNKTVNTCKLVCTAGNHTRSPFTQECLDGFSERSLHVSNYQLLAHFQQAFHVYSLPHPLLALLCSAACSRRRKGLKGATKLAACRPLGLRNQLPPQTETRNPTECCKPALPTQCL